jgi:hypothetical protein
MFKSLLSADDSSRSRLPLSLHGGPMSNPTNRNSYPSEEEMRNTRLARGLRAVAATVIVGGIVIAAFDNGLSSSRVAPGDGPIGQAGANDAAAPLVSPAADAPTSPPAVEDDPALGRLDRAMEQHG